MKSKLKRRILSTLALGAILPSMVLASCGNQRNANASALNINVYKSYTSK
jgi:hypothetical protein